MTVKFLCSMLRDDLGVFLEKGNHTLYTEVSKLSENNEVVEDFRFSHLGNSIVITVRNGVE